MSWLAADGFPLDVFAQYGVLGALVLGFVTGWIAPGYQLKREQEENQRLRVLIEDRVIPAVEQSSSAMQKASEALDRSLDVLTDNQRRVLQHWQDTSTQTQQRRL